MAKLSRRPVEDGLYEVVDQDGNVWVTCTEKDADALIENIRKQNQGKDEPDLTP